MVTQPKQKFISIYVHRPSGSGSCGSRGARTAPCWQCTVAAQAQVPAAQAAAPSAPLMAAGAQAVQAAERRPTPSRPGPVTHRCHGRCRAARRYTRYLDISTNGSPLRCLDEESGRGGAPRRDARSKHLFLFGTLGAARRRAMPMMSRFPTIRAEMALRARRGGAGHRDVMEGLSRRRIISPQFIRPSPRAVLAGRRDAMRRGLNFEFPAPADHCCRYTGPGYWVAWQPRDARADHPNSDKDKRRSRVASRGGGQPQWPAFDAPSPAKRDGLHDKKRAARY